MHFCVTKLSSRIESDVVDSAIKIEWSSLATMAHVGVTVGLMLTTQDDRVTAMVWNALLTENGCNGLTRK